LKILVVGGGSAGLMAACLLKKRLSFQVDVVKSEKIGAIGVGEGSTEHFAEFIGAMGVDPLTVIKECGATLKSGVMFEGWGKKPYLHSIGGAYSLKAGQYNYIYAKLISEGADNLSPNYFWENKVENDLSFYQYHFNTFKLNDFLINLASSEGVGFFEDEILDVQVDSSGNIKKLRGEKQEYEYDFYIDCTGFKKLLIGKLGAKWISFKEYLPMKAAIVFMTPDEDEYNLWSLAKTMKYGWLFRTPVWGRHGNGYIFDSDFVGEEGAKKEIEELFGTEIEIGKKFSFDPGYLDKTWINNCVAIGLSSSFVEPLEASSIGASIQQAFLLVHNISNYNQKSIDSYNKSVKDIVLNIRDFLALHYLVDKDDSSFWESLKDLPIPDSLQNRLDVWKQRLPIKEDFSDLSDYILFKDQHFLMILNGLKILDLDKVKKEYMSLTPELRHVADSVVAQELNRQNTVNLMSHKAFLSLLRHGD